jgi:hypothetical protein
VAAGTRTAMATAVAVSCGEKRASEEEGEVGARVVHGAAGVALILPWSRRMADTCASAVRARVQPTRGGGKREVEGEGAMGWAWHCGQQA